MFSVTGRRPRTRHGRSFPRLEPLEGRSVPAGVVNATFAAGVLTITGVDDLTDVNVTNQESSEHHPGWGRGQQHYRARELGETGTAFTGGPFNGVTSIKLLMGLGNDTVTITDSTLAGGITFLGGSGDNTLNIDRAGNFSGHAGASPKR